MPDDAKTYGLSDEPPPKRRFVRVRRSGPDGFEPEPDHDDDRRDDPWWAKLMLFDPFPWLVTVAVLVWVGLGLWARSWPPAGGILAGAGLLTVFVSQLYLYALIYRDDPAHALMSFLSSWYRAFYLHLNMDILWRPFILNGCGVLMFITGSFMFVARLKPGGP